MSRNRKTPIEVANWILEHGQRFPYDGSDEFWIEADAPPRDDGDWAVKAARGVIADLRDRRRIKQGFEPILVIDEDVRESLIQSLALVIRQAWVYYAKEEEEG